MDFIAIDIETANADLCSICQIGLARFQGGEAVQWHAFLVDPRDYFDPINVSIHGITASDVAGAPSFTALFPTLTGILGNSIVVHHTAFDRVAICRAAAKHAMPALTCSWIDSARVARRTWERFSRSGYGLANLAMELGITFKHHDAVEDAHAAGLILLRALAASGLPLAEWLTRVEQPISASTARHAWHGNPNGPLVGEVIVFTGALDIPRREAVSLAVDAGCDVSDGVTTATTILVVGDQDIRRLNGSEKSSKRRKAEKLIAEGAALRIIGESDFRALLGPRDGIQHDQ